MSIMTTRTMKILGPNHNHHARDGGRKQVYKIVLLCDYRLPYRRRRQLMSESIE